MTKKLSQPRLCEYFVEVRLSNSRACEAEEEPSGNDYAVCRIPAGRYAKFVVHGDMVQAVAKAWQEIWQMDLPRTFQCDYEEYQNDSMENAEIHIYVGLKEDAE